MGPMSQREPTSRARLAARACTGFGWVALVFSVYLYDHAKPVRHSIDSFFGVVRRRNWDRESLVIALLLAFVSLILGISATGLAFLEPRTKVWRPPLGALVLVMFAIGGVAMSLVRLL